MLRRRIPEDRVLDDASVLKNGARLYTTDEERLGIHIATKECVVEKPDGKILFMLIKGVIDEDLWQPAWELLRQVKGDPGNRPGIIGEDMRMPRVKKDGLPSDYVKAPKAIIKAFGGKADLLGYYRYKNPKPGITKCETTGWTRSKPRLYTGVLDFIFKVNEVYQKFLPDAYEQQKRYIDETPDNFKIAGTVFTTLYVLKNAPTAVHTDDFDYPGSYGVMATLGDFEGGELIWPKYRIGVDYRPGDVLLGDVHEMHCNLPLVKGERVSCVFFVRDGIRECGDPTGQPVSS